MPSTIEDLFDLACACVAVCALVAMLWIAGEHFGDELSVFQRLTLN